MQIENAREKKYHTIHKFVFGEKQCLSADWLFTVHFAVTFQTKAKKPLSFLNTFPSGSCLAMFEFPRVV